ncbi:TIGR02588 family protein [Pleurocapsa sp. FMAR1]|uniref:TIGR02588 family protein n=1 Tax=Pleurocapsa sp. FMAR1 TaxID=3040204 RepID=UPI0029C78F84|nr:TIGR02588 family protein [Pleurocapsa sp. FMAR1]
MQEKSIRRSRRGWQGKSMAERVSFGVSLSIVGIVVALICFAWITGDNNPPILAIATESKIREINQQYYVPFTVSNSGGETAESVEVTASLLLDNKIAETGRQEIDFLSRQEKRSGEFIFTRDPQQGELIIRVASYKSP